MGTSGTQSLAPEGGRAVVLAYFADQPGLESRLRDSLSSLDVEVAPAEIVAVDWVARVREGFRPFAAGSFHIVPAWEPLPARGPADGPTLVVEPGLAFGTGSHESTRLCLAALAERAADGPLGDVLDVGAGSGILSVAAALLGASRVVAVELDRDALPVARRHAELNRVTVSLVRADGARALRPASFDLVVANVTAPLLIERAEELVRAARGRGSLVLAGLLTEDVPAVRVPYATRGDVDVRVDGEWAALVVRVRR
jgi:ribosomal protein L11 methyltransferase